MKVASLTSVIVFGVLLFSGVDSVKNKKNQKNVKVKKSNKVKPLVIPKWKTAKTGYKPEKVDWNAVISGCRATCNFDKRLCNFYIRAAAHDSLSIARRRGGADGSMLLTEDELSRPENKYDAFGVILAKNALALAKRFDASVADVIAVCGAVSSEYLGGPKIVEYDNKIPFLVGRIDNDIPNPAGTLPAHNINITDFRKFAMSRGFTVEEMTALMGSHVLIDDKGCLKENDKDICDPHKEPCQDLSMFKWTNTYYKDLCGKNIVFTTAPAEKEKTRQVINNEMCKFTSSEFRKDSLVELARELKITPVENIMSPVLPEEVPEEVEVEEEEPAEIKPFIKNGEELKDWFYTIHDANMGIECQRGNSNVEKAMKKFLNRQKWNVVYKQAYKKMVNLGAKWAWGNGYPITGYECQNYRSVSGAKCNKCNVNYMTIAKYDCPTSCRCMTSFGEDIRFYDETMNSLLKKINKKEKEEKKKEKKEEKKKEEKKPESKCPFRKN